MGYCLANYILVKLLHFFRSANHEIPHWSIILCFYCWYLFVCSLIGASVYYNLLDATQHLDSISMVTEIFLYHGLFFSAGMETRKGIIIPTNNCVFLNKPWNGQICSRCSTLTTSSKTENKTNSPSSPTPVIITWRKWRDDYHRRRFRDLRAPATEAAQCLEVIVPPSGWMMIYRWSLKHQRLKQARMLRVPSYEALTL